MALRIAQSIVESPRFVSLVTGVILFNAVILGLETSPKITANWGPLLSLLDRACLAFFIVEILLKLFVQRLRFFRDGWNIFDGLVIAIALIPATQGLSVLRALRIFRLLRVVSVIPSLRRVVEGFLTAVPGMASVFILMGVVFYIGAVIATKLFGSAFPQWFGSLGASAYSLFQIMTLESWSMGIVRPVMESFPQAWLFFIPFILLTTFTVMNLVVGLIVNSMQEAHEEQTSAETDAYRDDVMARLERIEALLDQQQNRNDPPE